MQKSRPTILQVIPRLEEGGAERTTIEIAEALVKAGARALVASEGGRLETELAVVGGEILRLPLASKMPHRIVLNARGIAELVSREGVSLIHARSRAPAWSAYLAARRLNVPFITTYHGAYSEAGPIKRWYNGVMAKGEMVIANSRYTAGLIRSRYGTPESRIAIVYRGIDPSRFDPAAVSPERLAVLRDRWGLKAGDRLVLMVARLSELKGQRVVIDAARLLHRRGALGRAVLVLAGGSKGKAGYAAALKSAIADAGLAEIVRLTGPLDDVAAGYALAEIGICASIEPEGFGRASVEAAAMACPVIVSDIGGLPETIVSAPERDITGWRVPPGDAAALAGALASALALPAQVRQDIGRRGREYVTARFTLDGMTQSTLDVYDRVLGTSLARQALPRPM